MSKLQESHILNLSLTVGHSVLAKLGYKTNDTIYKGHGVFGLGIGKPGLSKLNELLS